MLEQRYKRQRITVDELAEQLGVTPGHVRNKKANGGLEIKSIKEGSKVFFDILEVARYLEEEANRAA